MLFPKSRSLQTRPSHVCRLHKAIFGLKQAPRAWFHRLTNYIQGLGFVSSQADHSPFIHKNDQTITILLIYVDDIVITSNKECALSKLLRDLSRLFAMKDLGPLHYFLSLEAHRTPKVMHLTQSKYITELLVRAKMAGAMPLRSPVVSGSKLSQYDGDPVPNTQEFQSICWHTSVCHLNST